MTHYETKKVLKYVKKGSVSKLRSFLKKNDVNLNEIRDFENRGVLHLSCYLGECKMSRFLLRCGVDPCLTDCEGNTPIHIALKYALEFNNQSVFLNLILPLKKRSKRVMDLANKLGETPRVLYDKLKTALRNELEEKEELLERGKNEKKERERNEFEGENEFEAQSVERQEQQEWFEKLAFEEACEDFYFKDDHNPLMEEEGETYYHWAERIRHEYSTRYQKVTVTQSSTTEAKKQEQLNMNETLTKKLAKEHEEYVKNVTRKRTKREKERYDVNCQNVFECSNTDRLTFELIPWPCTGSAADMVDRLCEWAGIDKIGYLKVQRVRWHPDRFAQRCRHRIDHAENEQIMDLVKQISQGINVMISSL